MTYNPCR